jgi:hypothetical protein
MNPVFITPEGQIVYIEKAQPQTPEAQEPTLADLAAREANRVSTKKPH